MKAYKVYFQVGDKKLIKLIPATSQESAKAILLKSIIFHKVEETQIKSTDDKLNDLLKEFNTFFNK